MKSLKELIDERNRLMGENRKLLEAVPKGERMSAEAEQQFDTRDAEVEKLNTEIESRQSFSKREDRLKAYADIEKAPASRQIPPSVNNDGSTLTVPMGRRELVFRAGTQEHLRSTAEYNTQFLSYLNGTPAERLGMVVGRENQGGYLAPTQFVSQLIKFVDNALVFRQLASVFPVMNAESVGFASWDTDPGDADWTPEVPASDISEDDSARLGRRELRPHDLSKLVKISTKLLRSSMLDPVALLTQRLGYKLAVPQESAFMTGNGAQKPLGIFVASNDGITTSRDITASATTTFTYDNLIDVQEQLKAPYQEGAAWIGHRDFYKAARKLKDANGQYIWEGAKEGQPATLMGKRAVRSEYAPNTFTTGKYIAVYGDLKAGYYIVDGMNVEIQRLNELGALKKQVLFLGQAATDGAPVLEEAFSRLKLA